MAWFITVLAIGRISPFWKAPALREFRFHRAECPVRVDGGPSCIVRRSAAVGGQWLLRVDCCRPRLGPSGSAIGASRPLQCVPAKVT